jgi:diacylglycerol kinase (ATP)
LKPKYNFFKNSYYAIEGLINIIKNETSFKIELILFIIISLILLYVDISFIHKAILFISMFLVLLCEAINSAIERVVDLVSPDYHILAKNAKDIGSFVVLLSIITTLCIWSLVLYVEFIIE